MMTNFLVVTGYLVKSVRALAMNIVKHTEVTLIERIESARKTLGWSQRQLGREAGLKNESHYSVVLAQFGSGGGAKVATVDLIVGRLVQEGWSETWLRHGTGPEMVAAPKPVPLATQAPVQRTFTPTPAPNSRLRVSRNGQAPTIHPMVQAPANRERAKALLSERGYDASTIDEELALVAFDAKLAPCEDRPVSWWIDALRARLQG